MEHGVEFTRAGLKSMLTPKVEDSVTEEVSLEQLRREVADVCNIKDEDVIVEDPDDAEDIFVAEERTVLACAM